MKAVVTGATGLVGRHVIKYLLKYEFTEILAIGRNKQKLEQLSRLGIEIKSFDLTSKTENFTFLDEWYDALWFHCAAALSGSKKELLWRVNVLSTKKLIAKAEQLSIKRFVHVSSIAVYGLEKGNFIEESEKKPESDYGKTKLESEQVIQESSINWTIFRPSLIGGPFDQNFLVEIAKRIIVKKMHIISRNGSIDYIDARDLAECIVQASLNPISENQIYNIQSYSISYQEFVEIFGETLGEDGPYGKKYPYRLIMLFAFINDVLAKLQGKSNDRVLSRYRIKSLTSNRKMNTDKIKKELNFQPKYSIQESICDWMNSRNERE